MKNFKTTILGRRRYNALPPLPKWLPGLTMLNSNGDLDPASFGYDYALRTTQQIRAKIIRQKFFEISPADFMPVIPGEGAFKEGLITNYTFDLAGPFGTGLVNTSAGPAKMAQVDAGVAPKATPIATWAKGYQYNKLELEKAVNSGNWNPVTAKTEAFKKHSDLGLQKVAFLGMPEMGSTFTGLINNADVAVDTTTITSDISTLTPDQFNTFVATILGVYRENANRTEWPSKFVMPEKDYLGMAAPLSPDFPLRTKLAFLQEAFATMTRNPGFEILGLPYCDPDLNAGETGFDSDGKGRYVLYKDDADCLQMDVPVPLAMGAPGTANNFTFEGVGYMQFGPVVFFRPRTALYFDHE